jgi:hypothetical protein
MKKTNNKSPLIISISVFMFIVGAVALREIFIGYKLNVKRDEASLENNFVKLPKYLELDSTFRGGNGTDSSPYIEYNYKSTKRALTTFEDICESLIEQGFNRSTDQTSQNNVSRYEDNFEHPEKQLKLDLLVLASKLVVITTTKEAKS